VAKAVHSEGGRLVLDQARWDKLDANAGAISGSRVDDKGMWLERGTIPAIHAPLLARLPTWVPPNWVRWCRRTWTWRG
jgi:hypothetical protein